MIAFLKKLQQVVDEYPDYTAVVDHEGTRVTTYRQLMDASDRIASYLINKGIGAENTVVVYCNRTMEYIAGLLGVIKAGAAWTTVENLIGQERIKYITQVCKASLLFDKKAFDEAMRCEPLTKEQYADPDPHQLAFIVFTSGSTGNPKGAAQEYGIYDWIMLGTSVMTRDFSVVKFANIIPLTFVGGIYLTIGVLQSGYLMHMLELSMVRDPKKLLEYIEEHDINMSFMPPSLASFLIASDRLKIRRLHVGGEIVSNVYSDRFSIQNIYGPTEFGYPTCIFDLDKAYKNTPVGRPVGDTQIRLINEEGEIQQNEGILCIYLPYFRGYINGGSERNFITIEGKRFFRTEDIASLDKDGRYTILGRSDDMIKINGNRIDPSEVESAIKKILGINEVAVRAHERDGVRFLCAYYACDKIQEKAELDKQLKKYIPEYMMPACYIPIDRIPINRNGKIIRRELPEPDEKMIFSGYAAPVSDTEKSLCCAFERALNLENGKIGIDDDFFLLGGDSVRVMQIILDARIPALNVWMIYKERTVRKIAKALETAACLKKTIADKTFLPVTVEQEYYIKQEMLKSGQLIYNMPIKLDFKPDIDLTVLKKAVKDAYNAHPALLSEFHQTPEGWKLSFNPDFNEDISEEHVCSSEIESSIRDFVNPFMIEGQPLFRRMLLITSEQVILLMDIHQLICDGYSLRILCEDILNALNGCKLQRDIYYDIIRDYSEYRTGDGWKKDRLYFDILCETGGDRIPKPDGANEKEIKSLISEGNAIYPLESINRRLSSIKPMVKEATEQLQTSQALVYMAAAGIVLALYNNSKDLLFTWTWSGRGDTQTLKTVGLLIRDIPIYMHLEDEYTLKTVASNVRKQVREGVSHGKLSYFMDKAEDKLMCFLYQGNLKKSMDHTDLFDIELPTIPVFSTSEPLEIKVWEDDEEAELELCYNTGLYSSKSMNIFADLFEMVCQKLFNVREHDITIAELRKLAK